MRMSYGVAHYIFFVRRFFWWLISFVIVCFFIAFNRVDDLFSMPYNNSPEKYFDGRYLDMAKSVLAEDIPRLQQLSQGYDLNYKGREDMTLMWYAINNKKFISLQALVALGVNPDAQISNGIGSALYFGFESSDLRILRAILDGGFDPNFYDRPGFVPLMLQRGVEGSLDHVKLLLEYGTRINDKDTIGGTALTSAINRSKPDIAMYLIRQGADFETYTVNGVSVAWMLEKVIDGTKPENPIYDEFKKIRDLLIEKNIRWPPSSPEDVRFEMRSKGESVVVPHGYEY